MFDVDVPVTSYRKSYPFSQLAEGESVFLPLTNVPDRFKARKAAQRFAATKRWSIITRSSPIGIRVYRLRVNP